MRELSGWVTGAEIPLAPSRELVVVDGGEESADDAAVAGEVQLRVVHHVLGHLLELLANTVNVSYKVTIGK